MLILGIDEAGSTHLSKRANINMEELLGKADSLGENQLVLAGHNITDEDKQSLVDRDFEIIELGQLSYEEFKHVVLRKYAKAGVTELRSNSLAQSW